MAERTAGLEAKRAGGGSVGGARERLDAGKELRSPTASGRAPSPDRRLKLVPSLLMTALILGLAWMAAFYTSVVLPAGIPGEIPGQVIDPNNAPIEGALVTLEPASLNISAVTDANGNFTLTGMPTGRTTIVITKPGYNTTTIAVYALPVNGTGSSLRTPFPVKPGSGTEFYDEAQARDNFSIFCLALFGLGNVMTAAGLMAVITRRRYSMAAVGCLLGTAALGFWMGALLNLVAYFMIRSARDQFEDQSGIVAPGGVPRLAGYEDDDADEREDEADGDEEGDEGTASDGASEEEPRQ